MATNKKITELTEVELGGIADDDVLVIVDISENETKKVRRSTLRTDLAGVSTLTATSPLAVDAAIGDVTVSISGQVPVTNGGTGASTAAAARTNLGLGTISTQDYTTVDIDGGTIDGTPIGATTQSTGGFSSLTIASSTAVTSVDTDLTSVSASDDTLASAKAIKTYVDAQVGTVDTLSEILATGNTTGANNIIVTAGQSITVDTISETTAAGGVTVDSLLIKDGGITAAGTSTFAGQTISNLGTVTTADINGGTIDGTVIGGSSAAAGTFTTFTSTGIDDNASSTAITIDSSQNATFAGNVDINKSDPAFYLYNGSQTSGNKRWKHLVTGTSYINAVRDDADATGTTYLQIDRTSNVVDTITFRTGSNATHITLDGSDQSTTFAGDILLGDNQTLIIGSGSDLRLRHDGSNSIIEDQGTGNLYIRGQSEIAFQNSAGDETYADFTRDGAARLMYDNGIKLATTSTGIAVTGDITASSDVTAEGYNLSAIATDIADTAVDVFVYDTNKDSDGGAWRKRTQNTSWYNETLNTATRGSRKEFPAVAVIVAEASTVTIYDGDDPDLPMWMIFDNTSGFNIISDSGNITSVAAINGQISVGQTTYDLRVIDFLSDTAFRYFTTKQRFNADISQRNSTTSSLWVTITGTSGIVNRAVNDVAMTVLPNAPIGDNGLAVPTIAVATADGISVITDSGAVYDVTSTQDSCSHIEFTSNNQVAVMSGSAATDNAVLNVFNIPTADASGSFFPGDSAGGQVYSGTSEIPPLYAGSAVDEDTQGFAAGNGNIFIGRESTATYPLTILDYDKDTQENGMACVISSDYNTGWMPGDIKLAALSDTDATNVTGSELVTNGDFATDSDWDKGSGWSIGSGVASCGAHTGNTTLNTTSGLSWVTGKKYVITFEITAISGSINIASEGFTSGNYTTTGTVSYTRTKSASDDKLYINALGTNTTVTIDNVSVRLAEEDRSVNGNGLQVFGTVNKTAVATGAELVAYSGWSTSNYLKQPINSDLQGANNRTFVCWFKTSSTSNYQYLFSVGNESDSVYGLAIHQTTGLLYAYDTVNSSDITSSPNVADDVWHQVVLVDDGSNKKVYLDGVLLNTSSISAYTVDTDEAYCVGVSAGVTGIDYPFLGSLALQRFSHTVASAEQIAKMYNDEKYLFQDNADATLYGSSDAVTALAYDDRTELLHAGTSAGRSVFQGLRRVDNTTDAVGATISASNGLVADD